MSDLINPEAMSFLERAVRDPSIDVVKLEQIIALQERVADREAKRQFAEAMNLLQAEMTPIMRDRTNPHARSRYATYEAIDAILRPLYTRHGFSVSFSTHAANNRIRVGCTVRHTGGHSETEHELESGPDMTGSRGQANKTEVQGVGSIVSYLKRYTLMAAFAVALQDDETDDDGEAARRMQQRPDQREQINADIPLRGEPKGNGAQPLKKQTLKEWLAEFKANTDAALTPEEASKALDTAHTLMADFLATRPEARMQYEEIRNACIARLWPEHHDEEELPLIVGQEKLEAG